MGKVEDNNALAGPKHIGIILDGNRRFAKRLMKMPWEGHRLGMEKVKKLVEWCSKLGVKELTLYCFSMQNFNRPKQEFDYLMNLFEEAFNEIAYNKNIHKHKVKVRAIGRIWLLPEKVQKAIKKAEEATRNYNNYIINIAIAYGGREEIVDAVKKVGRLIEEGKISDKEVTEELISKNLYFSDEPDLIIRTGGEKRTSNFLIWQSNYSEWIFLEKTWPEFEEEDLIKCIDEYKKRERRFGR
ncbi:MAG: polyprenyl diphosphate synthase [Candidatus Woesearchaeota archaeon]|nr:polyprenyl diphosphate synthase [Candidatus Woesearchaeota archaeon]